VPWIMAIVPSLLAATWMVEMYFLYHSSLNVVGVTSFALPPAQSEFVRTRLSRLWAGSPERLFRSEDGEVNGVVTEERNLRFAGVGRLYSTKQDSSAYDILDRLSRATVTVVGLGGVGSWAAEALCRSGIGSLVLIDLDDICISNTNRQLHATSSTVGQMKLDEMKRRLSDINPHCNITLIHDFVSVDNVDAILDSHNTTALLDAMDGTKEKSTLLAACVIRKIPVVTCGAAAGRIDPTRIVVDDLIHVTNDRLLATSRKTLRKSYGFNSGVPHSQKTKVKEKAWKIQAVFSTEVPPPVCQGDDTSSFRRCDGPMGTACFVTGSYGFVAASRIVEMIATGCLVVPREQQRMKQQRMKVEG
jgi:tRNA threonylcarbamoyladenosine dehydratase